MSFVCQQLNDSHLQEYDLLSPSEVERILSNAPSVLLEAYDRRMEEEARTHRGYRIWEKHWSR